MAAVMETPAAPVEEIAMGPPVVEQVAMTTTDYTMPSTASSWPLPALFGALASDSQRRCALVALSADSE